MLTKPDHQKNLHLEVIRGLAAFFVVIDHLINREPEVTKYKNHLINLIGNWSTESVIIFFILSGIVIHSSIENRNRSASKFLIERIIRIHPILLVTITASVLIEVYLFNTHLPLLVIIGNFLPVCTVQGYMVTMLWNSNPVIWSLSCEIFFYVIFSIFIIKRKGLNYLFMAIWFMLGLFSLFFFYNPLKNSLFLNYLIVMLSYSPIWIIGFLIWKFKYTIKSSFLLGLISFCCLPIVSRAHLNYLHFDPLRNIIFSLCSVPMFLYIIQRNVEVKPVNFLTKHLSVMILLVTYLFGFIYMVNDITYPILSRILYICFPFSTIIFFIQPVKLFFTKIYQYLIFNPFKNLGSLSYSIYLTHNILIVLIFQFTDMNLFSKLLLTFTSIYIISFLLEKKFQPIFNKLLKSKYFY
jgi:peptidoglycan/LPS O-acetylase OafA/YrhL